MFFFKEDDEKYSKSETILSDKITLFQLPIHLKIECQSLGDGLSHC